MNPNKIKYTLPCTLFSCLFSAAVVAGTRIVSTRDLSSTIKDTYMLPFGKTEIVLIILLSIATYILVSRTCALIHAGTKMIYASKNKSIHKLASPLIIQHFQIFAYVLLMASWCICWLTFFPGSGMADTIYIMRNPIKISIQHTLSYDLLLWGLMSLGKTIGGNWTWGLALYSFVQMAYCAWIVSFVLNWMNERKFPAIVTLSVLLYFMFSRIVPSITITAVKDVIFSFSLLLMIPLLIDSAETHGDSLRTAKNLGVFAVSSVFVTLIRNNGIFVMIGVAICMVIFCRRAWKRILVLCLVVVAVPYGIDRCLMKFWVKGEKIAVESLGIPLQQMAAVVAKDGEMSEEEAIVMETIMPIQEIKERYTPLSVDSLKWGTAGQLLNKAWISNNKGTFLRTWASMLLKNLDIYVEAYLLQTLSYWNIGESCKGQGLYYGWPGWLQDIDTDLHIQNVNIFPQQIQSGLEGHYRLNTSSQSPCCGTLIWLILFLCVYFVSIGHGEKVLCMIPVLITWLTIMVSAPIAFGFRYVYGIYLSTPFLISLLFMPDRRGEIPA